MLPLSLFSWLAGGLNRRFQHRSDELQLRRELLAHQRRQLLHARIPDVYAARETFGPRFETLLALLIHHDPAGLGGEAGTTPLYPELTRTVLYQLPKAGPFERLQELLRQELALWFGLRGPSEAQLTALATAVEAWRH